MTDADRIKRLEIAVERLCDILMRDSGHTVDLELIRQYVRGDLDSERFTPPKSDLPYWKDR